jgi:UDP-GlcNAc:undecaprenyl-phosphate GlcNAc-1-phosphate transferase
MYSIILRHAFAGIFSFLIGLYLIPIIIKAALKLGFVDAPDGRLKHQKQPVAYLGGVGIYIPIIATLGLCCPFDNFLLWLIFGSTLLLFVGLIDDFKVLKPRQKFFGQFLAALCFLKGGFSLKTPFFGSFFTIGATLFWLLTIINAFNLVDVMDGLCAVLALCAALGFCIFALLQKAYTVSLLLVAFMGSVAAFLCYNRPPARIYLGDAGSMFIGGFLAAIPLLLHWDAGLFSVFATGSPLLQPLHLLMPVFFIPALVLAVPLLEVTGLFIVRTRLGIPFYNGSPHHFSIYLQKRGYTKQQILFFALLAALTVTALPLLLVLGGISWRMVMLGLGLIISGWYFAIFA